MHSLKTCRRGPSRAGTTRLLPGLLAFSLLVTPAEAGIMDSISGFFSNAVSSVTGLFGGKKKASANSEVEEFLSQVESGQQSLADAQTKVITYYNDNPDQVGLENAEVQTMLNDVADASRTNEDNYLQFLKVRAEALEKKVDLSDYKARMDAVQENQAMLEERYQEIQDFGRSAGLMEPPPSDEPAASEDSGDGEFDPNSIEGTRLIDSWLAANGLDEYGRLLGNTGGAIARANYAPDMDGQTRQEYVYAMYFSQRGRLNGVTLEQYVEGAGGGAATSPASGGGSVIDVADSTGAVDSGTGDVVDVALADGTGAASADVDAAASADAGEPVDQTRIDAVTAELNSAVKRMQALNRSGQGSTAEGMALLKQIRQLQDQRRELLGQ